jgi:hypothetical protein
VVWRQFGQTDKVRGGLLIDPTQTSGIITVLVAVETTRIASITDGWERLTTKLTRVTKKIKDILVRK